MAGMTSVSENEMNIQIPLCGFVKISLKKDALAEKKNQNTWKAIVNFEIFNAVRQRKFHSLIYHQ